MSSSINLNKILSFSLFCIVFNILNLILLFKNKKSETNLNNELTDDEKTKTNSLLLKQEINKQIKEIFDLQEKRVYLLNEFDIKFKEYLLDAPKFQLDKLKLLCKTITDEMNLISSQILTIKSNFSNQVFDLKNLFNLVEKLQSNEQIKFQDVIDNK